MTYYLLIIFLVLEYVRPTSFYPQLLVLHINAIFLYAMTAGSLFGKSTVSAAEILREPNSRMLLAFLGLIVGSVLTADVTTYATNVMRSVSEYLLVYWVITRAATDLRRIKGIFATLVLVHLVVTALTPSLLTSSDRQYLATGYFLGDSNDYALSVNIAIPLCLFLVFDAEMARNRLISAVVLFCLALIVVITQSRGGTVALLAVAIYYWVKSNRKLWMAGIAIVAVALVLALAPAAYWLRMNDIANPDEGSAGGRILAWSAGTRMALDHPILGVGAGHFAVKYGTEYRSSFEVPGATAHSIYFLALGELGFPGVALLLVLIISNFVANRRLGKDIAARRPGDSDADQRLLASMSASLIAFATGGAFLSALYYPHIYILAALLVATRRVVRERSQAAPSTAKVPAKEVPYHPALVPKAAASRTV